ncbi:glycosyltransferase family 4 protein [Chitinophaga sp. Mgbs1]|uniref:Glycosyltransferase family 4 protein n=1 Tax=Chitinophaga solisilvae TaxID=1233460 RepID=A0A9Q5D9V1_9BACT|nr:glycosyltransferase family 4 protein [Chitinophaga solisilvae]
MRKDMPADTGQVVTDIIIAMCRQQPGHQFVFFFDGEVPARLTFPSNVTTVVLPPKGNKAWHLYWWLEWQLPRAMKPFRPDVYLGLDGMLPLRSKIPAVLLIRDLSFLKDAGLQPYRQQQFMKKHIARYLVRAQRIAVLSGTAADELQRLSPALESKVAQLETGVSRLYQPLEWEAREAAKKEFSGGVEYFLVTGSVHPRNNIIPVFKAFSALKKRQRTNLKLVIAGQAATAGAEIQAALQSFKFRQDVVMLENLDEAALARLTGAAYAVIYPARFDGLPYPVYTAQRCKVPVIALEGVAAREAGGDTALYTDPANVDDLAEKMSLLYKDEQLRSRLLAMDSPVKTRDSWEQAAERLWSVLVS